LYHPGVGARQPADATVAALLQKRFAGHAGPLLIAVGGPGGIGKSTFSAALVKRLPDAGIVHLDDYKTPREVRRGQNLFGAHPDANMMDLIQTHLDEIKDKRASTSRSN
jgi:uridine kinase